MSPVTLGWWRYDWDGRAPNEGSNPRGSDDSTDADDSTDSAEELLAAGRPLPAWVRPAGFVLTMLLGVLVVVHLVGSNGGTPAGAPTHRPARWPQRSRSRSAARARADSSTSRAPAREPGLRLLVGGEHLQRVDFDTGAATPVRLPRMARDEWVDALSVVGSHEYAATAGVSCGFDRRRVLAIDGTDATHTVTAATPSDFVSDETHAWTVVDPGHELNPLTGGRRVALPAGFAPAAATDGVIVGNLTQGMDPAEIGAVRGSTGVSLPTHGVGLVLGAARGRYVWSAGCGPSTQGRCELDSASVTGKQLRTYRVPRAPGSPAGLLSPDGRVLAFTLTRPAREGRPSPPSDIALLHLRSGRLTLVPGVDLPARYQPQFAFAPSGGWLVIAASADMQTRLYAWRPGLRHPLESPVRGLVSPAAPPVRVLAGATG